MTKLPTGEELPDYDDEPRVDPGSLLGWLGSQYPARWGGVSLDRAGAAFPVPEEMERNARSVLPLYERQIVADVLAALQAVGDATLTKNATYRALVHDRGELERLGAGLYRLELHERVVEAGGNPVDAALTALAQYQHVAKLPDNVMVRVTEAPRPAIVIDVHDRKPYRA